MPSLSELQYMFGAALGTPEDHRILLHIMNGELSQSQRLSVHRNTFVHATVGSLALTFPAIQRLVGSAFFEMAVIDFLQLHPPSNSWLDAYGHGFPEFVAAYPPAASLPYLSDVARLELLVNSALRDVETQSVDGTQLRSLDDEVAEHVVFEPRSGFGLLCVASPVDEIWAAALYDGDEESLPVNLESGPVRLFVSKESGQLTVRRVSSTAWYFARALCDGMPLGRAAEMSPDEVPDLLRSHVERNHFRSFSIPTATVGT